MSKSISMHLSACYARNQWTALYKFLPSQNGCHRWNFFYTHHVTTQCDIRIMITSDLARFFLMLWYDVFIFGTIYWRLYGEFFSYFILLFLFINIIRYYYYYHKNYTSWELISFSFAVRCPTATTVFLSSFFST